jgi:hypothetical protein
VDAPRQSNDRLLLGLKGSLNEYELDLLRQRSVEARHEKAKRGELLITVPVGYIKTEEQRLEKNPDRRVQEAISFVFRKFRETQHEVLRYTCNRGWLDHGEPRCIAFGGVPVDDMIGKQVLTAVQPAAIEAAVLASKEQRQHDHDALAALERDLEAARYAAQRAQRQYDASDPENRLVSGELERRWNQALERVRDIESRMHVHAFNKEHAAVTSDEFARLADQLDRVWNDPSSDASLKKRIVRMLIQEVVADVESSAGEIVLVIHWKGGLHTEVRVPRRRRGFNNGHTDKTVVEAVSLLANICNDDLIAGVLNRNGHKTGRGNRWTKERVTALRSHHRIPCFSMEHKRANGWMNLTEAAVFLQVSPRTVRLAIDAGELRAEHPLQDGPWLIQRQELMTEAAQWLTRRSRRGGKQPAIPSENQSSLQFSST